MWVSTRLGSSYEKTFLDYGIRCAGNGCAPCPRRNQLCAYRRPMHRYVRHLTLWHRGRVREALRGDETKSDEVRTCGHPRQSGQARNGDGDPSRQAQSSERAIDHPLVHCRHQNMRQCDKALDGHFVACGGMIVPHRDHKATDQRPLTSRIGWETTAWIAGTSRSREANVARASSFGRHSIPLTQLVLRAGGGALLSTASWWGNRRRC